MGEIRFVGTGETRGYPYPVCKNIPSPPPLFFTYLLFFLHFSPRYCKLLGNQIKFSGTRKFNFRSQYLEMNFDFEISKDSNFAVG